MNLPKVAALSLTLVLALILGYSVANRVHSDKPELTIRTYSVPTSRAEEVKNILNRMFSEDKTDGYAQVFGNGTLVVKGSESYQNGISQLMAQVTDKKATLHTIHFDYWLVRGEIAAQSNAYKMALLGPVLESINKAQGPRKFMQLEHIAFNSLDHREVSIQSNWAQIKNISKEVDNGIEIMTEIKANSLGELKLNTQVKPGEFVILGENGTQAHAYSVNDHRNNPEDEIHPKEIYHIIRADILR